MHLTYRTIDADNLRAFELLCTNSGLASLVVLLLFVSLTLTITTRANSRVQVDEGEIGEGMHGTELGKSSNALPRSVAIANRHIQMTAGSMRNENCSTSTLTPSVPIYLSSPVFVL